MANLFHEVDSRKVSEDTKGAAAIKVLEDQVTRMRFAINTTWRKSMQLYGDLEKLIAHEPESFGRPTGDTDPSNLLSNDDSRLEFVRWEKERIEQSLRIEQKALEELLMFKARLEECDVRTDISANATKILELKQVNALGREKLAHLTAGVDELRAAIKERIGLSELGN